MKLENYTSWNDELLFREAKNIVKKIGIFLLTNWIHVETLHLWLTLKDFRRGSTTASLSYLVPLDGELQRVMSCPKTTVFMRCCWRQSCHGPAGQGRGPLTAIPSSQNVTSQQLMRNGDRLWTPTAFSGTWVGSSEQDLAPPRFVYNTLIHHGLWKNYPGTYTENCWFGSSRDVILQGCPMATAPGAGCRRVLSEAWRCLQQHLNSYVRKAQFLHKTFRKKEISW